MSKEAKNILHLNNQLDILPYYSKVSFALKNFLKGKKLAVKIHLPNFFFLRRGSDLKPLYIKDLHCVDEKMLSLRKVHLKDVKDKLSEKQQLVWTYFPPRKLSQFFYATNDEGVGKPIERIFIDIDRRKHTAEESRIVTFNLVKIIKEDKEFNKMLKINKIIIIWTGASFHVYLFLKNPIKLDFYNKYLSYGEKKQDSFIEKWANNLTKITGILVHAGHEKSEKCIILDSSNTPSGKLARAPFSLHIKDWKTIDGVCIPLSIDELNDKNLVKKLKKLTPIDVLKDLKKYERLL
jgi:hypothetical protein